MSRGSPNALGVPSGCTFRSRRLTLPRPCRLFILNSERKSGPAFGRGVDWTRQHGQRVRRAPPRRRLSARRSQPEPPEDRIPGRHAARPSRRPPPSSPPLSTSCSPRSPTTTHSSRSRPLSSRPHGRARSSSTRARSRRAHRRESRRSPSRRRSSTCALP